jgi:hydrogenase expression/formation protein HypE
MNKENGKITLAHGSGGRMMHELIETLFMKELGNSVLRQRSDSAIIRMGSKKIAFTTDSYVVDPIFFPGGDIGSLAVYGTVNDLSVCGAKPLYISVGIVIEEGFEMEALKKITRSVGRAAKRSRVAIVTGDTKVVEKGACDKVFINTSGIGEVYYKGLSAGRIHKGDSIIVSGPIGDHAISVLSKREGVGFGTTVKSDSAPLNGLISRALKASRKIRFMRDPTRGGVAATLNEIAAGASFGVSIDEKSLPVRDGVRRSCEMLGLDPLYLACEGRALIVVAPEDERRVLKAIRGDANGRSARAIGVVTAEHKARVVLETVAGGRRIVDMLSGEQLPRIC